MTLKTTVSGSRVLSVTVCSKEDSMSCKLATNSGRAFHWNMASGKHEYL